MSRWCHDIGREQAANKPLLKTVFQVTCQCNLCTHLFYIANRFADISLFLTGYDEIIQSS